MSDEADLIQLGQSADSYFYSYEHGSPLPSAWTTYPTAENPSTRYKFSSLEVNFSQDLTIVNRQTYMLLDWLGDLGGLLDALYIMFWLIATPSSTFALQSSLMSSLFRFQRS